MSRRKLPRIQGFLNIELPRALDPGVPVLPGTVRHAHDRLYQYAETRRSRDNRGENRSQRACL